MNFPQIPTPNNQLFSGYQNNYINQNTPNNYLFNNNNEIPGFHYQNQFQNNNLPSFQDDKKNNNKQKKKKISDEYITHMFGWICDLCILIKKKKM